MLVRKRHYTRIEGGFRGDLTGGRTAALLSSHRYLRAARRVCLTEYCSGVVITTRRGIGSDLAAAIRRPPQRLPRGVGSLQILFVSWQALELPSIHQGKIGVSCRGTLLECRSVSERLDKWQQAGIRFSSKTSPLKTIGLCDQNGRNVRRFAVLQVIPSSFGTNCWELSLSSVANLSVNKSSLG